MQGRRTNFSNILRLLGAFVATSLVLGLLGAGLVMPAAGAAGATARQGVTFFESLPSVFTQTPLSQQSRILASDGKLIATPYDENRVIVPLAKVATVMQQAQVAIEDSRFYEHGGVDPLGVGRAFVSNLGGGDTQGASTLTQQYVKITLQENALRKHDKQGAKAAVAKSYTRKIQELKYAVTLEKTLTKSQILEGYLNLVYFGGQAYGVEAAATHYFGVSAAQLNLPQAATLAGLVQAPSETDPIKDPQKAQARRNVVLDRMHDLNLITDKAWKDAKASPLATNPQPTRNSCAVSPYPYFCSYVTSWLMDQPALGKTRAQRKELINRGGLTIQTTLNPKMQAAAEQELVRKVPVGNSPDPKEYIGAAAAIVEPGTGRVFAIAQNTAFSKDQVNWAVDYKYGGSGGFAFGSTAKMFAVAQALKSGMPINSTIFAKSANEGRPAIFTRADFNRDDDCKLGAGQVWPVENDEGSHNGSISLTTATAKSVNTAFAGLVSKLGACKVRETMTEMGLHQGSGEPIKGLPSPITLGSDSVSPLTLASAYATAASGGMRCDPAPVLRITTSDKKTLALPKTPCKRVLEPDVANGVTKILKSVLTNGTASRLGGLEGRRPVAGKTGTSDHSNETWFVGYTPQISTAVWVGTPNDPKNERHLSNLRLGDQFYGGQIFGSTIAAPIWKSIMDRSSTGMPFRDFADPGERVQRGELLSIPAVAGMSVADANGALTAAGFRPRVGGGESSSIPAGQVVGTRPGSRAERGSTVVIIVSTGPAAPAPQPPAAQPPPNPGQGQPPAQPQQGNSGRGRGGRG